MCVRHSTIPYQSFGSSAGRSRCGQALPRSTQLQPLHPYTFVKGQIERASRRPGHPRLAPCTLSLARYDDTRGRSATSSLAHHRMFVMIVTDTCKVPDVQFPPLSVLTLYTRPSGPQPVSQRNRAGHPGRSLDYRQVQPGRQEAQEAQEAIKSSERCNPCVTHKGNSYRRS
jgi:hypothetical protein